MPGVVRVSTDNVNLEKRAPLRFEESTVVGDVTVLIGKVGNWHKDKTSSSQLSMVQGIKNNKFEQQIDDRIECRKNYACTSCTKTFSQSSYLKIHINTAHRGQRITLVKAAQTHLLKMVTWKGTSIQYTSVERIMLVQATQKS